MRILAFCLSLALCASPGLTQELGLAAPAMVRDSGLLKHILPRFSLKTGIRVIADDGGPMELATQKPGTRVFRQGETTFYLRTGDDARQERFRDWLVSDIGKRTIEGFQPADMPAFSASFEIVVEAAPDMFEGDAALGADLSLALCGRCHVVGPQNRMNGIGSTPSFTVLRALPDWSERFQQFYVLNPHPSFTQVEEVTPPFDPTRPPPIAPITMSLDDLDAILVYVQETEAADLGAPIKSQ